MEAGERLRGILCARELRWQCRQTLGSQHRCALLTASLRAPSRLRQEPDFRNAFDALCQRFEEELRPLHSRLLLVSQDADGPARHYAVTDALAAKRLAIAFEEQDPGGALLDLDLLTADGKPLGREQAGHGARACAVCGQRPASACIVGGAHAQPEIESAFRALLQGLPDRPEPAEALAGLATRALLYEAAITPKPGLVDRQDAGAHRDMDFYSFIDSALKLKPWFLYCARQGAGLDIPPEDMLARLRPRGLVAEREMLQATGGANTHKGLIFSLGILCAAAGRGEAADVPSLCALAGQIAAPALSDPLGDSHGDRVRRRYGGQGARGEAARGFPAAQAALPVFLEALSAGHGIDEAGRRALYRIMALIEDSNVLHRAGQEGLRFMQEGAEALISGGFPREEALAFDRALQARGISPGGSADSLALCLFLWLWSSKM